METREVAAYCTAAAALETSLVEWKQRAVPKLWAVALPWKLP